MHLAPTGVVGRKQTAHPHPDLVVRVDAALQEPEGAQLRAGRGRPEHGEGDRAVQHGGPIDVERPAQVGVEEASDAVEVLRSQQRGRPPGQLDVDRRREAVDRLHVIDAQ
jgi:hypothetical protein